MIKTAKDLKLGDYIYQYRFYSGIISDSVYKYKIDQLRFGLNSLSILIYSQISYNKEPSIIVELECEENRKVSTDYAFFINPEDALDVFREVVSLKNKAINREIQILNESKKIKIPSKIHIL